MKVEALGKLYHDGDVIVRQGEMGNCMYVIQEGQAEVLQRKEDKEYCLGILKEGDCFGEMALFEKQNRSATVRALGDIRVLTLEKTSFLRRVHEDPSLAFKILQTMSARIRELDTALKNTLGRRRSPR